MRARQRTVANPALGRPADITALQRAYGNQAIQRILIDKSGLLPTARTVPGRNIQWDAITQAANCHGHTYGTHSKCGKNPSQGPQGVGVIVEDEAGGVKWGCSPGRALASAHEANPIQVGNLVTINLAQQRYAHSARVDGTGPKIEDVTVSNKQGSGGPVEHNKPLLEVDQARQESGSIIVWQTTPISILRSG
jgi:hypothetical protein